MSFQSAESAARTNCEMQSMRCTNMLVMASSLVIADVLSLIFRRSDSSRAGVTGSNKYRPNYVACGRRKGNEEKTRNNNQTCG